MICIVSLELKVQILLSIPSLTQTIINMTHTYIILIGTVVFTWVVQSNSNILLIVKNLHADVSVFLLMSVMCRVYK